MKNGRGIGVVTRRSFVSAAGVAALATGVVGHSAVAHAAEGNGQSFDETYDVVVVGYGFAGAMAAIAASDEGAKVLLCDSAPEGEEGGNSRFCAQIVVYGQDRDKLRQYYQGLGQEMDQDPDVLDAYVDGLMGVPDIFKRMGIEDPCIWSEFAATAEGEAGSGGNDETDAQKIKRSFKAICPEYPEVEGSDTVDAVTMHPAYFDGAFYPVVQQNVQASESITVWLESPAKHLIQDADGAVTGVIIEHDGGDVRVGANGGVVLACGGFECNRKMIQDFIGVPRLTPIGGMHNNGDGIRMAQEVGADLWHMHNYESLGMFGGNQYEVEDGQRCTLMLSARFRPSVKGAIICVADDGSRFLREDQIDRHGHLYNHGIWRIPNTASHPHMVFDEAQKAVLEENGHMPLNVDDVIVSAQTAEELAGKIGADPDILARTIERFNGYAQSGEDVEFGRDPEYMRAFEGTLYALPLEPSVLNTQGGPRRNAKAQVVDTDGNPIPHLYSAGECGGVNAFYYQGGGNVGECLVFGKIAGTNAADGAK
ncbi:MAG: FAD-dependent oxidoreductase [Coriobacteriales bacterium]|jgi:succinate dehydrogenase/fumarate reductase flavoprotein subunit